MDILDQLPKLAEIITKGGVTGVLLIVCGVLAAEVIRLRKVMGKVYMSRDKWRTGFTICKAALDFNKILVDLSAMQDVEKEDA